MKSYYLLSRLHYWFKIVQLNCTRVYIKESQSDNDSVTDDMLIVESQKFEENPEDKPCKHKGIISL